MGIMGFPFDLPQHNPTPHSAFQASEGVSEIGGAGFSGFWN
jgi:hypothetical protein